jgi:putative acetyltransferase
MKHIRPGIYLFIASRNQSACRAVLSCDPAIAIGESMPESSARKAASESLPCIRLYRDSDHDAVRALFLRVNRDLAPASMREAFEAYIEISLREEIDRIPEYYDAARGRSFWVLTGGDVLLGCFGLEPTRESAIEIRRMYVNGAYRRRGLGTLMLGHAEKIGQRQGASKIVLSTSQLQQAAVMLYRSAGYIQVREEYAQGPTNKTVGHGIRRFHFEKPIDSHIGVTRD